MVLYETDGTNEIYYTYDVDGSLISMRYNETEYFYVFDVFGDVTHLLDSSGNVVVEYLYDAYGNIVYQTTGTLASANPYRYRGYRFDEETGLYYLQSRYYNPVTARFINADGMLKASNSVLGHNMFAYTENNPVMKTDPSGYCAFASVDDFQSEGRDIGCGGAQVNSYGGTGQLVKNSFVFDWSIQSIFRIGISVVVSDDSLEVIFHYGGGADLKDFKGLYNLVKNRAISVPGASFSVGVIENYNNPGDFSGDFYYAEGGYIVGAGRSWDGNNDSEAAVTVKYISLRTPGFGGGYDYYMEDRDYPWNKNKDE